MDNQDNTPIQKNDSKTKSSTGLDENLAGLLCYLGVFVTGIIFVLLEKSSAFVKFHAMQSIVIFGGLAIVSYIVDFVPFFGWLFSLCISFLSFILWIFLMVKAYNKEMFKVPIASAIAENLVDKLNNKQSA